MKPVIPVRFQQLIILLSTSVQLRANDHHIVDDGYFDPRTYNPLNRSRARRLAEDDGYVKYDCRNEDCACYYSTVVWRAVGGQGVRA